MPKLVDCERWKKHRARKCVQIVTPAESDAPAPAPGILDEHDGSHCQHDSDLSSFQTSNNMPPRLQLLRRAAVTLSIPTQQAYQPLAPFLYPFLSQQRSASILSSLSDNKGAYNKRIRLGRGPASGKGKTSGRGHKGQKQHGKVPAGFNGGQTPDWVVAGPRGFKNL